MEYFVNLLKKAAKSLIVTTVAIVVLWGALWHLTDFATVAGYFGIGVAVCVLNTWLLNFKKRKVENIFRVQGSWVIMAGAVLVLYYAGFEAAAILVAAAILASPFFWASIYEGIVGLSLLLVLAKLMF